MVIFSPTGWVARYSDADGKVVERRAVEKFADGTGDALVVDDRAGCLVAAATVRGFGGLEAGLRTDFPVVCPPGWTLSGTHDDGRTWTEPVAAFVVSDVGFCYPVAAHSGDGMLELVDFAEDSSLKVSPPEVTGS